MPTNERTQYHECKELRLPRLIDSSHKRQKNLAMGRRCNKAYIQRLKLEAKEKARALGEPSTRWRIYSNKATLFYRRWSTRTKLLAQLVKKAAPVKPNRPEGNDNSSTPTTSDRASWKQYQEDLEKWGEKYAEWRAQMEHENVDSAVEVYIQRWVARVKASNRATAKCRRFIRSTQEQDLGNGFGAETKIQITGAGAERQESGSVLVLASWRF